jgi:hypothetical protein
MGDLTDGKYIYLSNAVISVSDVRGITRCHDHGRPLAGEPFMPRVVVAHGSGWFGVSHDAIFCVDNDQCDAVYKELCDVLRNASKRRA